MPRKESITIQLVLMPVKNKETGDIEWVEVEEYLTHLDKYEYTEDAL